MLRLEKQHRENFAKRIGALNSNSQRLWGEMDLPKTLCHLRCAVDVSLGKISVEDKSSFFSRTIFCYLAFSVLPWPKGKIKAPEILFPIPQGELESERRKLLESIDEFIAAAQREPSRRTVHPMFGPQKLSYWSQMHGKHFDHHFRQFGV